MVAVMEVCERSWRRRSSLRDVGVQVRSQTRAIASGPCAERWVVREGEAYELKATDLGRSGQVLLLMLAGRYDVKALRRKRQRHDTVILAGPETFLEEVLWPMYGRQLDAVVAGHDRWLYGVLSQALPE